MSSILKNIAALTKQHGSLVSDVTLNAEVTHDDNGNINFNHLTEVLFSHGFENQLSARSLADIPALTLPVLIFLQDQKAAIIKDIQERPTGRVYRIYFADGEIEQTITHETLSEAYIGYCWFVKPKVHFDGRSELPEYNLPKAWFWKVIWRFKHYYYQVIVATFTINILALTSSFYMLNVYDRVIPNRAYETLWVLTIGVFIAIGFEFAAKTIRAYLTDVAGKKADLIISSALFRRVMSLKLADKPLSSGSYANNLRDFEAVRDFMTSASLLAIIDLPFLILFLIVIYILAGNLVIVPIVIIPLILLVGIGAQKKLVQHISSSMQEASLRQGLIVESLEGIETLKTNNAVNWVQKKWDDYTAKTAASSTHTKTISSFIINFSATMIQLSSILLVLVGTYMIHSEDPNNSITMGALIATVLLSRRALAPLSQVAGIATRYQQAKLALEGIHRMVEKPIERDYEKTYLTPEHISGALTVQKLNYHYTAEAPPSLKQINFSIKAGEKVAILGRVGSGKSTLLRILAGLYEPAEGQVALDNIDLRQIDPHYLRNSVYLLGQNPRFFWGSLRENLCLGLEPEHTSDDEIMATLERVNMHQFVQAHPAGLDMPLGEDGAGLSSGQKQLFALARLFLHQPQVVLVDEPTANLDPMSENMAINALRTWLGDRTAVIVTHRPRALQLVERVVVMNQAQIAIDGPKQAVLDKLANQ
ncbi:MAG: type I secretion system permease/ATPase [Neisseriaceae bacterium]|nr:type I secretion system permease/ATPase [Neisseriaceae bacterium]